MLMNNYFEDEHGIKRIKISQANIEEWLTGTNQWRKDIMQGQNGESDLEIKLSQLSLVTDVNKTVVDWFKQGVVLAIPINAHQSASEAVCILMHYLAPKRTKPFQAPIQATLDERYRIPTYDASSPDKNKNMKQNLLVETIIVSLYEYVIEDPNAVTYSHVGNEVRRLNDTK